MAGTTTPPEIGFRAAKDVDRVFLFEVYASSREEELRLAPWTIEEKRGFLTQQFEAQDHHYRTYYEGAEFLVIQVDGRDAGRLYVHRVPGELLVIDIALLPIEQRQGVGTRILADLVSEADRDGRTMSLHVEHNNQARRLYDRLGFRVSGDTGVYLRLERAGSLS